MSIKSTIFEVVVLTVLKWSLLLAVSGLILYFVLPKYEFVSPTERYNKVSGTLEVSQKDETGKTRWVPVSL